MEAKSVTSSQSRSVTSSSENKNERYYVGTNTQDNKNKKKKCKRNFLSSDCLLKKKKEEIEIEIEKFKDIKLGDIVSMKDSTNTFTCYAIIANIFRTYECNKLYCQVFWLIPKRDNFASSKFKIGNYKILPFKNDTFELADFTIVQKVPKDSLCRIMYSLNGENIEKDLEGEVKQFDWDKTCFDFLK